MNLNQEKPILCHTEPVKVQNSQHAIKLWVGWQKANYIRFLILLKACAVTPI
jgi:hypothetical protein